MSKTLNLIHLAVVSAATVVAALGLKLAFGGDWFEFAAVVTGVIGVYLAAKEEILNWPVGIANVLIYAYVFFQAKLYADMTLQLFFCALAISGWIQWAKGGTGATELKVTRLSGPMWLVAGGCLVVGTAVYTPIIEHFKGAAPFIDSLLAVASIIAQLMLNAKKLENWILWILIDAAYIPLYYSRDLKSTAVLYGLFLVLAVLGLFGWLKTYRAEQTVPA